MKDNQALAKILIADDEASVLYALETILRAEGPYHVFKAQSGNEAWRHLQNEEIDIALIDLMLQDLNGLSILKRAQKSQLDSQIILITGHGSIDTAVQAMRMGAYDYLTKPVDGQDLLRIIAHAVEKRNLLRENQALQQQLESLSQYQDLIGKSPVMQELYETLKAVAPTGASVFIAGESGTGKELVARAIHKESKRAEGPFLAINCAALPENILESELFGYQKGAFTGATHDRPGYFEQADHGTIFLDEIAEMPYDLQAKLLRVLETQSFRRLGGEKEIQVDIRVIAATNRDPKRAVSEKALREDLYYRLAVIEIEMPPLRKRREDIPLIVSRFLPHFARAANKSIKGIEPAAMQILRQYSWPGNVRELRNAIERAVILCRGKTIQPSDLPARLQAQDSDKSGLSSPPENEMVSVPLGTTIGDMERQLIMQTLEKYENNKTRTAKVLGISLKTLHNKLRQYTKPCR